MREIGQNLFSKTLFLTILIKICLRFSNLTSKIRDVNLSIDSFLGSMNLILDEHAPLKQVNKYNLKFKSKPWIIPAIQTSISVKNYLPKRFIKSKDPQTKQIFCEQYKDYRNVLSTLLKKKNKLLFRVPHRC